MIDKLVALNICGDKTDNAPPLEKEVVESIETLTRVNIAEFKEKIPPPDNFETVCEKDEDEINTVAFVAADKCIAAPGPVADILSILVFVIDTTTVSTI